MLQDAKGGNRRKLPLVNMSRSANSYGPWSFRYPPHRTQHKGAHTHTHIHTQIHEAAQRRFASELRRKGTAETLFQEQYDCVQFSGESGNSFGRCNPTVQRRHSASAVHFANLRADGCRFQEEKTHTRTHTRLAASTQPVTSPTLCVCVLACVFCMHQPRKTRARLSCL